MASNAGSVGSIVPSTVRNITYSLGLVRALVPLSPRSIVGPAALRTQHNVSADSVIRCRIVKPATPGAVVAPAGRGDTLPAPPLNPPVLVDLRHPGPNQTVGARGHDIAHGGGVYTPSGSGGRIRLRGHQRSLGVLPRRSRSDSRSPIRDPRDVWSVSSR